MKIFSSILFIALWGVPEYALKNQAKVILKFVDI
jgi:hypothetical protein